MQPLKNQIALVTGASRGIGQAIAHELAKQGALVAGTATTPAGAEKITAEFNQAGLTGHGFVLNVNDTAQMDVCLTAIKNQLGAPSILVNNAGITRDNLFLRMKDEEWNTVIAVNLTASFRLSRAAVKGMMRRRYGRIVNIGSVVGATGNPGQGNYAASNAGPVGMAKALAAEVASRNITVNCVAPGFIESPMTDALNEKQRDGILGTIPMGRLGRGDEIASAVVYLASD